MKTVGAILREERLKQAKTIPQIHEITRISEKTLQALEENDSRVLPEPAFVKGLTQVYARTLGLNEKNMIAIFKRDSRKTKEPKIIHDGVLKPLDLKPTFWNPKTTTIVITSFLIVIFFSYLGLQIKNYFALPKLMVNEPPNNKEVKESLLSVQGQTDKEVSVYVNAEIINVDEKGKFIYQLDLFPGENTITVKAVSRRHKETIITRKVKLLE